MGCGEKTYVNAINLDRFHEDGVVDSDVIGDGIVLPFKAQSFKAVFSSHSIEHLSREDHIPAILEWRRVLIEGGHLIITLPDFEVCLQNYTDNYMGNRDYWYMTIFGANRYSGDSHLSGLPQNYLSDLLFNLGFEDLKWKKTGRDYACMGVKVTKTTLSNERIQNGDISRNTNECINKIGTGSRSF